MFILMIVIPLICAFICFLGGIIGWILTQNFMEHHERYVDGICKYPQKRASKIFITINCHRLFKYLLQWAPFTNID